MGQRARRYPAPKLVFARENKRGLDALTERVIDPQRAAFELKRARCSNEMRRSRHDGARLCAIGALGDFA